MAHQEYVVVYNVSILDDIHNYFPALLYEQGQFQTVPHVLHYVRSRINNRFNLYSYGASLHRTPYTTPIQVNVPLDPTPPGDSGLSLLFSLLNNPNLAYGAESPRAPRTRIVTTDSFLDPVIIRPTDAIIAQNTSVVNGHTLPAGTICTICQDSIQSDETCRKLNVCNHSFHKPCIDQWFLTNVRCPTCRHDVRIANT